MLNHLKQQNSIRSFPSFFLSLSRYLWTNDHMAKDYSRVTFPVRLDIVPYPFLAKNVTFINWLPALIFMPSHCLMQLIFSL
jgi:hypothetical protein